VSDCIDHAAVQQAQSIRTEIDRNRDSIAAITIEKKRCGAIARRIAAWTIESGTRVPSEAMACRRSLTYSAGS